MKSAVFVHGLPDNSGTWEKLLPRLLHEFDDISVAGLPGLSDGRTLSERSSLSEIARLLVEELPRNEATYIGHDFGGILGSLIAESNPNLFSKMVLINSPRAHVLRNAIFNDSDQSNRSQYAFKIVESPEKVLSQRDFAFLKAFLFRDDNSISRAYQDSLVKMWSDARVQKNIGTYYRAVLRHAMGTDCELPKTLQIWSRNDPFIGRGTQQAMKDAHPSSTFVELEVDSHWPHLSVPDHVAEEIIKFVRGQ